MIDNLSLSREDLRQFEKAGFSWFVRLSEKSFNLGKAISDFSRFLHMWRADGEVVSILQSSWGTAGWSRAGLPGVGGHELSPWARPCSKPHPTSSHLISSNLPRNSRWFLNFFSSFQSLFSLSKILDQMKGFSSGFVWLLFCSHVNTANTNHGEEIILIVYSCRVSAPHVGSYAMFYLVWKAEIQIWSLLCCPCPWWGWLGSPKIPSQVSLHSPTNWLSPNITGAGTNVQVAHPMCLNIES